MADSKKVHILIVDDDEKRRTLYKEILGSKAYNIDEAEDGGVALKSIRKKRYDLLLVDFSISDKSCEEFIGKASQLNVNAEFIVFAGLDDMESSHERLKNNPIADILIKPLISSSQLLFSVTSTLETQNQKRQLLLSEEMLEEKSEELEDERIIRESLEAELVKVTTVDKLTQTYNRLKLEDIMTKEMERAKRHERQLTAMLFDIDFFKKINDTYGHVAGDYVLKTIASIAKKNIREVDYLIRLGGEEFLIVAPDTTLEKAEALAERIRMAIENYKFNMMGNVTVSFGAANYKKGDVENSFLKRADEAMFLAKEKGRNQVVVNKM